jgi:hypothetical protein
VLVAIKRVGSLNTRSNGDGREAGDAVTAAQMRALYGAGMYPVATQGPEQLRDTDLTDANIQA